MRRHWVQQDGSARSKVDFDAAEAALERALTSWLGADCAGETPAIDVRVMGPIACGASEFDQERRNANLLVFRDDDWPYVGAEDALGLTRVRFRESDGEILDADIEINGTQGPLSVGEPVRGVDLDSLLTHEVGHFLGLAHSKVADATMIAGYVPNSNALASLADDDVAGICNIYPPGRKVPSASCQPYNGFSELCAVEQEDPAPEPEAEDPAESSGCSFSRNPRLDAPTHLALLLTGTLAAGRRGRRGRRHRKFRQVDRRSAVRAS